MLITNLILAWPLNSEACVEHRYISRFKICLENEPILKFKISSRICFFVFLIALRFMSKILFYFPHVDHCPIKMTKLDSSKVTILT